MSATNEMTAIKWKRSERLHAARIVLHEMSNEMSMNVSWNANDLWNEWYSVELTQLKELKATGDKGAVRRNNDRRKGATEFNPSSFIQLKEWNEGWITGRTEGRSDSFQSIRLHSIKRMNGIDEIEREC